MLPLVRIKKGKSSYSGFLLSRSNGFVVISEIRDFYVTGFLAFPGLNKGALSREPLSKVWAKGARALRLKPKRISSPEAFKSLGALLKYLKATRRMFLIDCKPQKGERYFLGEVVEVGKDFLVGRYFDTDGNFSTELEKIRFASISQIEWDSPYERAMQAIRRGSKK